MKTVSISLTAAALIVLVLIHWPGPALVGMGCLLLAGMAFARRSGDDDRGGAA